MEVDALIAQQRLRLQQHQQFLSTPSNNGAVGPARPEAQAHTTHTAAMAGEEAEWAALMESAAAAIPAVGIPSGPGGYAAPTMIASGANSLSAAGTPRHPRHHQQPQRAHDVSSHSSHRPSSLPAGTPRDYHHQDGGTPTGSSRRMGGYSTGRSGTKLYERGQRWMQERQASLERRRDEARHQELEGCSFTPSATAAISASGSSGGGAALRLSSGSADREFYPRSLSPASRAARVTQQPAAPVLTEPSVQLHVRRQLDARADRDAAQRRLTVDTTNFDPRPTVPREFALGRDRHGVLTSAALRRPFFAPAGGLDALAQRADRLDAEDAAAAAEARGRSESRSRSPGVAAAADRRRADKAAAATVLAATSTTGAAAAGPQLSADNSGVLADLLRRVAALEAENARLQAHAAQQQREAEVAKAKVRELTLLGSQR
jgi:hypothetical protein